MKKTMLLHAAGLLSACMLIIPSFSCSAEYIQETDLQENLDAETEAQTDSVPETEFPEEQSSDSGIQSSTLYVIASPDGSVSSLLSEDPEAKGEFISHGTDTPVPVNMTVTYTLDGSEISPSDLAGKSGRVSIRYSYQSSARENGITVPMAVLTFMVLDAEHFSNVDISNGRKLEDGSRIIAAAVSFPGLSEELMKASDKLHKEELAEVFPDYVEITADASEFTLNDTYSAVLGTLANEIDPDLWNLTDEDGHPVTSEEIRTFLTDTSSQITEAMTNLTSGAGQIYDGLCTLADGCSSLSDGASSLSDGLNELSANSASLNEGAKEVFVTLLSTATQQIKASGVTISDLTIENYSFVLKGMITLAGADSENGQALTSLLNDLDSYNTFYQGLQAYTSGVDTAAEGAKDLSTGAASASEGAASLRDGALTLSDGLSAFDEQAVQKVTGLINDDLIHAADNLKELYDAMAAYASHGTNAVIKTEGF